MLTLLPTELKHIIITSLNFKQLQNIKLTNKELNSCVTNDLLSKSINKGFPRDKAKIFEIDYYQIHTCYFYMNNKYFNEHIVKGDIVILSTQDYNMKYVYDGIKYLEIEKYSRNYIIPYVKDVPLHYWPDKYVFHLDFRTISNKIIASKSYYAEWDYDDNINLMAIHFGKYKIAFTSTKSDIGALIEFKAQIKDLTIAPVTLQYRTFCLYNF